MDYDTINQIPITHNKLIKTVHYVIGIFLVVVGVLKYITLSAFTLSALIFIPAFLIIFGIMMIGVETQNKFLFEYCKFLYSYLGRGLFNVFLAGLIVDGEAADLPKIFSFVMSIVLLIIGIIYIIASFNKKNENDNSLQTKINH